jgi:hypothetical protein
MHKPFGQLTSGFQPGLEQFISDLDASYLDLRGNAVRLLESIRAEKQSAGATARPIQPLPPSTSNGDADLLITRVVENAIRAMNRPRFSVVDVRAFLHSQGSKLKDSQMSTAFRKLVARKRPESPLEILSAGAGSNPSIYRLKPSAA